MILFHLEVISISGPYHVEIGEYTCRIPWPLVAPSDVEGLSHRKYLIVILSSVGTGLSDVS